VRWLFFNAGLEPWRVSEPIGGSDSIGQGSNLPSVPKIWWEDPTSRTRYMDWVGKKLNYKSMGDFYKITAGDLIALGGAQLDRPARKLLTLM